MNTGQTTRRSGGKRAAATFLLIAGALGTAPGGSAAMAQAPTPPSNSFDSCVQSKAADPATGSPPVAMSKATAAVKAAPHVAAAQAAASTKMTADSRLALANAKVVVATPADANAKAAALAPSRRTPVRKPPWPVRGSTHASWWAL